MAEKEYIEKGKINDYISKLREYVLASVGLSQAEYSFISDILTAFENFPAADVEPVHHGHWYNRGGRFHCSVCDNKALLKDIGGTGGWSHEYEQQKSPYCPNCGARMGGVKNA